MALSYFVWDFVVLWTLSIGAVVTFAVLLLSGYTKICRLPIDCDSGDPCAIDSCESGWCVHRNKENCCRTTSDCAGSLDATCRTAHGIERVPSASKI